MVFYEKLPQIMEQFQKRQGGFLTVKNGEIVNTMTISWGFTGVMWAKPYFITLVRPQRHTRGLIDEAPDFTVSVPFDAMAKELTFCGTKSGRDVNKAEVVDFVPSKAVVSPVVSGCDCYFECVRRYMDDLKGELMPKEILAAMYKGDLHRLYFGEIVECYGGDGQ